MNTQFWYTITLVFGILFLLAGLGLTVWMVIASRANKSANVDLTGLSSNGNEEVEVVERSAFSDDGAPQTIRPVTPAPLARRTAPDALQRRTAAQTTLGSASGAERKLVDGLPVSTARSSTPLPGATSRKELRGLDATPDTLVKPNKTANPFFDEEKDDVDLSTSGSN